MATHVLFLSSLFITPSRVGTRVMVVISCNCDCHARTKNVKFLTAKVVFSAAHIKGPMSFGGLTFFWAGVTGNFRILLACWKFSEGVKAFQGTWDLGLSGGLLVG